ncbi:MAG: type II toxin-antitoxin system HipA family toxin [Rhodospirillaceae bacterium]
MERRLLVYADLEGVPHLVGRLWGRSARGRESASFEYDAGWLEHPARFPLEPALALGAGPQHTAGDRALFGGLGDSAPDRWGRTLIQRDERRRARAEKRAVRTLSEIDYLLGVGDFARQGALRFAEVEGGPFLKPEDAAQIPPLVRLGDLLTAALHITADEGTDADLRLLLAPGSSLGGSRPKASVLDRNGHLLIAKFPQADDTVRINTWEGVAFTLAARAKIPVPGWRLEPVGTQEVMAMARFDRKGAQRIPFLSAMSMLGARDNEPHSYMELADALRQHGASPAEDCADLWRRIVFNIMIANTDDHLRNHGFLYGKGGWRLAPAYDLNPMPMDIRPRVLSLAIDEADATGSLELAFEVAAHFGVKAPEAKAIVAQVAKAVGEWRTVARDLGLKSSEIERMASAFLAV